jgi:IclR family transcriptional regulator, pca regulon regulatory protein
VTETAIRDGAFVQSLERGLLVMRALSLPGSRSLSDVARDTGLSRATVRRFLLTLQHLAYVKESHGRFSLTPRVLELGHAYLSSLTLPELAQPHLERLVGRVRESSSVSVLDGSDVVYVARVPMRRIMTVAIGVGARFPAYATSMGRILLAGLDNEALQTILDRTPLAPLIPRTTTTRGQFEQELARVRRQGWALVDDELEPGLRSIAVPIRDARGAVAAAVNVSVTTSTGSAADMKRRLLPALRETAGAIECDLTEGRADR